MSKIKIDDYFIEVKLYVSSCGEEWEKPYHLIERTKKIPIRNITDIELWSSKELYEPCLIGGYHFCLNLCYYNKGKEYNRAIVYDTEKEMLDDWKKLSTIKGI